MHSATFLPEPPFLSMGLLAVPFFFFFCISLKFWLKNVPKMDVEISHRVYELRLTLSSQTRGTLNNVTVRSEVDAGSDRIICMGTHYQLEKSEE